LHDSVFAPILAKSGLGYILGILHKLIWSPWCRCARGGQISLPKQEKPFALRLKKTIAAWRSAESWITIWLSN
jgi:hypothetical protein